MSLCAVTNCTVQSQTLFRSPSSKPLLRTWQQLLNIKKDFFHICDHHFEGQFVVNNKRLTPDAVPSLFINKGNEESADVCLCCLVRYRFGGVNQSKCIVKDSFKEIFKNTMDCEVSAY